MQILLREITTGSILSFVLRTSSKFLLNLIREQLNIELPPAVSQPAVMRSDLGVAYSTGLGGHLRSEGEKTTASSSANFAEQRENVEKTKQFFKVLIFYSLFSYYLICIFINLVRRKSASLRMC